MSNQIEHAKKSNPLAKLELKELIGVAIQASADIASSIIFMGNILSETGLRYGQDGINIVCDKIGLSRTAAGRLVAAYRGTMHPAIAMGGITHSSRIERLTLEAQTDIINNGVLFVEKMGKTFKSKRVMLEKLSQAQVAQCFDGNHLLTEDEQFQYIKEQSVSVSKHKRSKAKPKYEIKDGKLIVYQAHTFDAKVLIQELANQI